MRPTMPMINGMVLEAKNEISQMTDNRSIIVDTHAFGFFRKDLIHNIGLERTKGFLFRYGWNLGRQDAKDCKRLGQYSSLEELIEYGPILHSMKGYVKSITTKLEIKEENNQQTLHMESIWKNSFEADEHLDKIGISSSPVCDSLAGYASGFVTEAFGHRVIFKEVSCRALGNQECYAVGKSEILWGSEIKKELYYLNEMPIVKELELTYETLLQERDHLMIANTINKILTKELVNGANLDYIIQEVYRLTDIPTAIHTVTGQSIAFAGFDPLSIDLTPETIFQAIHTEQFGNRSEPIVQTVACDQKSYLLLTSPIILQRNRMGYCSFLFVNQNDYKENYSQMIIERVSSICALSLFYEKTKLDSFEQMKSLFLKEILSGHFGSSEEMIAKASLFQLDLTVPFYICVFGYGGEFKDFDQELLFRNELYAAITQFCKAHKRNYLLNQKEKRIHLLITAESEGRESISDLIDQLYREIVKILPKCELYVGVSKQSSSIQEANTAYKNAIVALRMAFKGRRVVYFDSLGVVGALINENNESEVREMAKSVLGNIYGHDQKETDFIRTLYLFLLNGGNLEKTADDLALSVSGLRYRIHKLEILLQKDLRNPMASYHLLMAIQALIILGDLDLKVNGR
nr:XylR N-terminal domain-containing protein [uncultured Bacillus sp.]